VFVDTDPDTRLVRRLKRDTEERGRKVEGILEQYLRFVKPAFDTFIAPGMKCADIIVPRGGENEVAIDLIVKQVKTQLAERGYDASKNPNLQRADMVHRSFPHQLPSSLHIVPQTPQVRGLHTFIRNRKTPRMFLSKRLAERHCKMGKILIQTNERTMEPELYYLRLPKNVQQYKILLMDATVATVHSLAYAFPKVTLLTTAVDAHISESYYVIPGMGNFGDRYFGTEAVAFFDDNSDTEDAATQNTDECSNSNNDDRGNGTETAYANNLQSTDANRNQNKSNEGDCGKCFDVEISQKSLDLDSPQSSGYGSNIQENITDDSPDTEPNYQSSSQ
uniref:Phosphoribulokinase/uridine kinase domain-containing protein n=1 Tax=Parascaris equorum TaxID=6256 RepID=A0A914RET0_PAREQ